MTMADGQARLLLALLGIVMAPLVPARDGDLAVGFGAGGLQRVAFDAGGGFNDLGLSSAVQSDGKVLLGGLATGPDGTYDFALARLTTGGVLDSGFGTAGRVRIDFALGGFDDSVQAIAIQPDGRIVAVGRAAFDNGTGGDRWAFGIVRLTSGGAPDLGFDLDGRAIIDFDPGGSLSAEATGVVVLPDGRIVVAGSQISSSSAVIAVTRLNANGTPDTSFNGTGRRLVALPTPAITLAMALRPDGRLVLAGAILDSGLTTTDMFVAQLQSNGELDPTFGPGGYRLIAFDQGGDNFDIARALTLDGDGRVIVAGQAQVAAAGPVQVRMALARLTATGALDASFGTAGRLMVPILRDGIEVAAAAEAVQIDGQGRIVVAGAAGPSQAVSDRDVVMARLLANGSLDETFGDAGRRLVPVDLGPPGNTTDGARSLVIDTFGRIVAVGSVFVSFSLNNDMLAVAVIADTLFEYGFE
jgi:uncharacterized delta-60 repeat protein